jgi:hypothetical protein
MFCLNENRDWLGEFYSTVQRYKDTELSSISVHADKMLLSVKIQRNLSGRGSTQPSGYNGKKK